MKNYFFIIKILLAVVSGLSACQPVLDSPNLNQARCEAEGKVWRPEGKAQIPTCVSIYSDGGQACTSSNDCQGDCIVNNTDTPAMCAHDNSQFGCRAIIEQFQKDGNILCID